MGRYSKLIGAVLGNLATVGFAECVTADGVETCTSFGFSQAQITATVLALFNTGFVYFFPPNAT